MFRRIERLPLLAVVGPSGAGKSSFLQAGIVPMLPPSWGVLTVRPGANPFLSLGEALAAHVEPDAELARDLLRFDDAPHAIAVITR